MADRFGIDLGTTNSAVCYYDQVKKTCEFLRLGSQTRDYFPTIIAYRRSDGARFIGEEAKRFQFSKKYDVYSLFKLSLGETAQEKNGREKSPYEAARDFLEEVIREFSRQTGCEDLNNLVLTVPDVWKNESKNKVAVDNLMQIFQELGLEAEEQAALESEPVSAAAYYGRQICEGSYAGYVIVIDYGGGTLDLTLCRVEEGGTITVLHRCGDGGDGSLGCAGTAFDTALTRRLAEKWGLGDYAEGTNRFAKLRGAVENAKISATEQTRKALISYYEAYDAYAGESYDDNPAFTVTLPSTDEEDEEYQVMASDVAQVFAQVNAPALTRALENMKAHCAGRGIDLHSQQKMRILMVGGFSNLYAVEALCRERFASAVGARDDRFDDRMRYSGRPSIAIAHGAAIIAAGAAKIDYLCQSDVGFYHYHFDFDSGKSVSVPATVIRRDTPVQDYREPKYDPAWYRVDPLARELGIWIFFDDGTGAVPVQIDETFRQLLEPIQEAGNAWQIGFSMGRHRIPMLHVRSRSGQENKISLNRVLSRIALRRISPENMQEETL